MVNKDKNNNSASSLSYSNAKVVLLGDSGVGKSGLCLALTGQPFAPTASTHGRHVWTFDSKTIELDGGQREIRETLLWDLAGQPGYRLIHQLYLNEVTVALVVFDALSEDPFAGIRFWDSMLRQIQYVNGSSAPSLPMKKFLVAARMDRGGIGVSHVRIESLTRDLDFDDYFVTSARESQGINELVVAIRMAIDWEALPRVSSTQLLQHIKTFLVTEKEAGRVLSTAADLYNSFLSYRNSLSVENTQFQTYLALMESLGLIRQLSFGDLILLQPELFDTYASALVNAVKDEPDGLGSISEERVRFGDFAIPGDDRIKNKKQENLLLIALIEDLLRHEIALREQDEDGPYLVFPSQSTRENPDLSDPEGKSVIFSFQGAGLNIYSTLAVRLSHSGMFRKQDIWKNATTYIAQTGGECGILLRNVDEGHSEIILFFDKKASEETRFLFEEYVNAHLQRRAIPGTIQQRHIFVCPTCGTLVSDLQVIRRQQRGFNWIACPVCDTKISLLDGEERLIATPTSVVLDMNRMVDRQRDREVAQSAMQGKIATGDFDVFLCHISGDKPAVRKIGEQLKERGILPWLDEWEIRPGLPWQRLLEKQIGQINSAAVFVGKGGIGPWQQIELDAFLREFVNRGCPIIPVLLEDAPQEPQLPIFLRGMTWVDFRRQDSGPMDRLIWGITGKRISPSKYLEKSNTPTPPSSQTQRDIAGRFRLSDNQQESDALWDINEIRLAIGDKSFSNYRRLARSIIRRMGATTSTMIESPHFAYGTAWELTLPKAGLQFDSQKAILLLRQKEEEAICYRELLERAQGNAFIIIMDIADVPISPFQSSPRTIWFPPNSLIEMIETSQDQMSGWLGRFIITQVEVSVKRSLLPYETKGATNLFFGRDNELMSLTRPDKHGGIITGAHSSGKSSLLKHLKRQLEQRDIKVIGPYELGKIGFQTFFERTLEPLDIAPSPNMTPESWAAFLRNYRKTRTAPVFLLDEVDDLLILDMKTQFTLGRQIRSLNNEGHCKFYMAGHAKLREATRIQFGPFQNFANEFTLTGLTENASKRLTQIPMKNVGFDISDKQAKEVFKGTAGVPFLIQDFCVRLICGLSPSQASKPSIEDVAIEEVAQSPDYLETVFHYYEYDQDWDSKCIMLITAILGEVTRQDILQELEKRRCSLRREQLDKLLRFLIEFGVIKAAKPNLFTILSKYLYQAIMTREPESLLDSLIEEEKQEG